MFTSRYNHHGPSKYFLWSNRRLSDDSLDVGPLTSDDEQWSFPLTSFWPVLPLALRKKWFASVSVLAMSIGQWFVDLFHLTWCWDIAIAFRTSMVYAQANANHWHCLGHVGSSSWCARAVRRPTKTVELSLSVFRQSCLSCARAVRRPTKTVELSLSVFWRLCPIFLIREPGSRKSFSWCRSWW